jgi:hypothetical protein
MKYKKGKAHVTLNLTPAEYDLLWEILLDWRCGDNAVHWKKEDRLSKKIMAVAKLRST